MMLRSVGLQRGWRVLDAGCGTGGYLPIMAELVGQNGEIAATDIAPEHIEIVRQKAGAGRFASPITAHVADLKGLPFGDNTFDAVWNANVFQYLHEAELRAVLAEFRRVLKPGGVLAVKDGDISALQVFPVPSVVLWRLLDGWVRSGDRQALGLLESLKIDAHMRSGGFVHVSRRVTFIERRAPLRAAESQFVAGLMEFFGKLAPTLGLPKADTEFWQCAADDTSPEYILKRRDLYLREAAVLAVGYEPSV